MPLNCGAKVYTSLKTSYADLKNQGFKNSKMCCIEMFWVSFISFCSDSQLFALIGLDKEEITHIEEVLSAKAGEEQENYDD